MVIDAQGMHFQALNQRLRESADQQVRIENCNGQRYIGSGLAGRQIEISGTPGNALGSYLDGGEITVLGNAQDATGDTMNAGAIYIHGSCGDATGYAMRGGCILVQGDAGYRAGIHMKEYREKKPVLIIGGRAGCFLGEYQAGGVIVVLGIGLGGALPVGEFCGTGMHGGKILLRSDKAPEGLPPQVSIHPLPPEEEAELQGYAARYCSAFGGEPAALLAGRFWLLRPNTKSPYRQLYTAN